MKYVMIMVLALGVSACGQTVQGVGKDIIDMGQSVVDFGKEEKKSD
jgi:predicted small secreted protein